MTQRAPPLNALRTFHVAARLGSFARAAQQLNLTAAAVSHQVKVLEAWIGVDLFERSARGVRLSAAGADYASRVGGLLDDLVACTESVRQRRVVRTVTIRGQYSVGTAWLMPRIAAYQREHTDARLRVHIEPESDVVFRDGADLAVYHANSARSDPGSRLLLQGRYRLYAAPSLMPQGRAATVHDVLRAGLLHTTPMIKSLPYPTLDDWLRRAGATADPQAPGLYFTMEFLTAQACALGCGFALLLDAVYRDAIDAGLLVEVPGPVFANPAPYVIHCRPGAPQEAIDLRDWLLARAADPPAVSARR